jgi:hypothetical protein
MFLSAMLYFCKQLFFGRGIVRSMDVCMCVVLVLGVVCGSGLYGVVYLCIYQLFIHVYVINEHVDLLYEW